MNVRPVKPDDPIVSRLRSVSDSSPDLQVIARLYENILPLVRDADIGILPLQIDSSVVNSCLESGTPVFSCIDLEVDLQAFEKLMMQLVQAVEFMAASEKKRPVWKVWQRTPSKSETNYHNEFSRLSNMAIKIRMSAESGQLALSTILDAVSAGDYEKLEEEAVTLQLDPGLLWILAKNALKPVLNHYRTEIANKISGIHWDKGFCFVCGSKASLGELQENDQVKHLRCGQCGADWQFNRLECLHCGKMEHTTQQTFSEEGCDSRRIDACDACLGYLKVIASFIPTPPELLAVEDLATLHLDFIAQKNGYGKIDTTNVSTDW
jgi:FdhE protein